MPSGVGDGVWETCFPYTIFHTDYGMKNRERRVKMRDSRQALLMSMTMMEAAAMAMLDCIAEERAAIRQEIEQAAAGKGDTDVQ